MNMESTPAPSSALPSRSCPRCLSPIPERAPGGLCPRCLLDGANAPTDAGLGAQAWKTPTLAEIASAFPELEVLGHLGTGGMGCVYRVRERDSGRISALKVLPRELAADPAFVERFEREARTLSRLRHPHIVGVHGFGQAGGFCFLLMEFVDGANLRQALQSGRFTPQQALALIPPICEALQAAHAQGVLHRDIKPENLLLDAEGLVKIADFGIAKLLEGPGASAAEAYTLTRTGARIGTPHYMAP
ncbi:MAG: Serine/threonine-protein kinase PknB, partial [Verrucomicrobiota bacterium]